MTTVQASRPGRVVASSLIGTVIEWYEFYIYGTAAALVFDQIVLPEVRLVHGYIALVVDVCHRLRRAARGCGDLRPLR